MNLNYSLTQPVGTFQLMQGRSSTSINSTNERCFKVAKYRPINWPGQYIDQSFTPFYVKAYTIFLIKNYYTLNKTIAYTWSCSICIFDHMPLYLGNSTDFIGCKLKVVLRTSAETFAALMDGQTHDIISHRLESLARTGE